jgi:dihydroflavonol-4-reductase
MNIQPNKSTILVTGATGFVGAYVTRDLINAGYTVKAIRRSNKLPSFISNNIFDQVEWINGDILDIISLEEAMTNTDAVIHCAAKVSFRQKDRDELFKTNIEGTANIINIAIEKKIQRLIHVSSIAAIGRIPGGGMASEQTKWVENKLQTAYSLSKYKAELEVWRGIGEGLHAVIVNPSLILGYGDWNASSSSIFKNIYNGFPWYTNGTNGFVDVEDVSKAILQLLPAEIHAERFILNGDNWNYRKLFNTIADAFGKKRPWREAKPWMGAIAWRVAKLREVLTGHHTMLSKETAKVATATTMFDNNKILKALPNFWFTPLEETIEKACKLYTSEK